MPRATFNRSTSPICQTGFHSLAYHTFRYASYLSYPPQRKTQTICGENRQTLYNNRVLKRNQSLCSIMVMQSLKRNIVQPHCRELDSQAAHETPACWTVVPDYLRLVSVVDSKRQSHPAGTHFCFSGNRPGVVYAALRVCSLRRLGKCT